MTRRCWQQILAMVALAMFCLAGNAASEPSYKLTASSQKDLDQLLVDLVVRSPSKQAKLIGYESLVEAARNGCPSRSQLDRIVEATAESASDNEPIEMFLLPPLVRLLYQFESCFTKEQINAIATNLSTKRQRLFDHGTINHAAMRATSWNLLAQKFKDSHWINSDGKKYTSSEVENQTATLLKKRWAGIYQYGHYELISPTYSIINLFTMLNLVDFSNEKSIKSGSNAEANLSASYILVNSFRGIILPPITRKNYDQRNKSEADENYIPSVSQSILKFYTGKPTDISNADWSGRVEPPYVIMLALSNWRPLADDNTIEQEKQKGLHVFVRTPGFSKWGDKSPIEIIGESYITDNYSISSGNARFKPGGYYQHIQTNTITYKSNTKFNQIECFHPYFSNPPKKPKWGTDRWSPMLVASMPSTNSIFITGTLTDRDPWPAPDSIQHKYNRIDSSEHINTNVFCATPKDLNVAELSPTKISASKNSIEISIQSHSSKIEKSRDLKNHIEYIIGGPHIAIEIRVNSGKKQETKIRPHLKPTVDREGYISPPEIEFQAHSNILLESRGIHHKNGILRIKNSRNGSIFTCNKSGCTQEHQNLINE